MVTMPPHGKTEPHHHGDVEVVIYMVSGRLRLRWGDQLESIVEAGPGDFLYVPPYAPYQESNPSPDEACTCVVVRSSQASLVVRLDIPPGEAPTAVVEAPPMPPPS